MNIDNIIKESLELINLKKFDNALKKLEEVQNEDSRVYFLIGSINLSLNNIDLAKKNLLLSNKLNNNNPLVFHNLGIIAELENDIVAAKDNYLNAIKINDNIESLCELGKIMLNENNLLESKKYLEKALEKDANYEKALYRVGKLYLKMNYFNKGWKSILKATGVISFSEKGVEII
jgi:tetratricopeptide (TPR) repeat protein